MEKVIFNPPTVHKPGLYSHAIKVGNTVYLAGQVALDVQGNLVGKGDIEAQVNQTYENIRAILKAVGATMGNVVKQTTYITKLEYRPATNEARKRFFKEPYPASTLVVVSSLALPDFLVEIETIAVVD